MIEERRSPNLSAGRRSLSAVLCGRKKARRPPASRMRGPRKGEPATAENEWSKVARDIYPHDGLEKREKKQKGTARCKDPATKRA